MKAPAISPTHLRRHRPGRSLQGPGRPHVSRPRRADLGLDEWRATSPRPPNCANGSATSTNAGTIPPSATTRNWPARSNRPA